MSIHCIKNPITTILLMTGLLLTQVSYIWAQSITEQEIAATLTALANSERRDANLRARNQYRHPVETLLFFGLRDNMNVAEIWPGGQGGWYRSILEPFLAENGNYVPVMPDSGFPDRVTDIEDNSMDMVLVFREHSFLIYDQPVQKYYSELYRMLKPGGIFGIVDHRELESRTQDPKSENGYVKESFLISLAENAGFELLEKSEINANPLDNKDHPDGVYSLPPTLRGTLLNRAFREQMLAIGESDRMTLKFIKPPVM